MSAVVCEPLKDGKMLIDRIYETDPKKVLLIFWHGVGDLVMFLPVFYAIRGLFPGISFKVGVPAGLTYPDVFDATYQIKEDPDFVELTGDEVNVTTETLPFDLVAKITFPMNESQNRYTKGEWCCRYELGIPPVCGHGYLRAYQTPIVAVHFQITCLPGSCNPDRDTAERVWNDILGCGFVPIECHYQHIFHNPVNERFDFIDSTVRRARPVLRSLIGLIGSARAFIGVVSGPFHVALATLPTNRVMLLEKDFTAPMFTKSKIATADLRNYSGEVRQFLGEI